MMVVVLRVSGMELLQIVQVKTVNTLIQKNKILLSGTALCPDLTLTNGVISYGPDTTPRLEGTVATHSCVDGYILSGGTERTCQSDRTWSRRNITCEGIIL